MTLDEHSGEGAITGTLAYALFKGFEVIWAVMRPPKKALAVSVHVDALAKQMEALVAELSALRRDLKDEMTELRRDIKADFRELSSQVATHAQEIAVLRDRDRRHEDDIKRLSDR